MNQDQQPRPWWKDNWPVLALLATVMVIVATGFLGYWRSWQRPFWDWLELLVIPVVLGAAALWFTNQQNRKAEQERTRRELERDLVLAQREREHDRELAVEQVREEALQQYLDRMQELILDKGLRRSQKDAEIRDVARARTLSVLRNLDGNRKGHVVRFLHEAELVVGVIIDEAGERQDLIEPIIDLRGADLTGVTLIGVILIGTNLSDADLRGADLRGADLSDAELRGADLRGADLRFANLSDAKGWTNYQLTQAESLVGAILPDGTVITEEAWEEFKKHYRQSS
jgi:hypothetical protein